MQYIQEYTYITRESFTWQLVNLQTKRRIPANVLGKHWTTHKTNDVELHKILT